MAVHHVRLKALNDRTEAEHSPEVRHSRSHAQGLNFDIPLLKIAYVANRVEHGNDTDRPIPRGQFGCEPSHSVRPLATPIKEPEKEFGSACHFQVLQPGLAFVIRHTALSCHVPGHLRCEGYGHGGHAAQT